MLNRKSKKKIVIADRDDKLCVFLQKNLHKPGYDVDRVTNGEGLPKILEKKLIDLVVLDVDLSDKEDFYWLEWLQQYHPSILVFIVSVRMDEDARLHALEKGALDYLIKPFHTQELLIRLGNAFSRKIVRDVEKTIQLGDLKINTMDNSLLRGGYKVSLTSLEVNILKLLYLNAGVVQSRDDIMEYVRGVKHNPFDRSIDIHINKIRKKIEDDPANPLFIRTERGKGYYLHVPN